MFARDGSTLLRVLGIACLLPLFGCGAGAPPVSIQAPVGSLIAASEPDANGNVTITGQSGSVEGNATVTAANPPLGTADRIRWQDFWIKPAFAQSVEVSTTADASGAFSLVIPGNPCDDIGVRQSVGDETSSETIVQVPGTGCGAACSPVNGDGTVPFGGACDDNTDCAGGLPCVDCTCV